MNCVISHQACWFIGKIRKRLAASDTPVAEKRRAVNQQTKLKKTLDKCVWGGGGINNFPFFNFNKLNGQMFRIY
jgi:hypothetical protein